MPIPKPRIDESDEDFLSRCMSDTVMVDEYSDTKQRYAVCQSQLRKYNMIKSEIKKRQLNVDNVKNKSDQMKKQSNKKTKSTTNFGFDVVSKKGEHIVAGYGSYVMIDSDDQLVTRDALLKGLKKFMKNSARRNIMFSHEGIQIGEVLDGYKSYTTHVDDKGLFIVAKIYDDIETAKDVWDGIEAGEFNAFSISFEPLDTAQHIVDGVWEEVRKLNLLEVSVCQNPKNPLSRFKILSKSKNVKETQKGEKMAEEELKHKPKDDKSSDDKEVSKSEEPETEEESKDVKTDETKTEEDTSEKQDSDEDEMDDEDEMKDKSIDTKSEEKQDGGGLVGAIREELSRLQQLGEEISAEDLNSLAQLVTNLRTGQGKSYPLPEKANKSEDTDWHEVIVNCINDLYSKLDSKSVKSKAINKSSDEVSKLKAEVVKKSEEAEDAKKAAEETKAVAEKDREVLSEVQESLKKVDETFTKFDERLKSLESQKDVKTKVPTEKLIEDYHPSNVRETEGSVEVIVEGED